MSRYRPVSTKATAPLIREFFHLVNQTDLTVESIATEALVHTYTIFAWSSAKQGPSLLTFEAALNAIGHRLVIQPMEPSDDAQRSSRVHP